MKRLIQLSILAVGFIASSCTNDIDEFTAISLDTENPPKVSYSRSHDESILSFEDYNSYVNALYNIESLSTEEEKEEYVRIHYPSFKSIHDVYMDAMEEMAKTDDNFGELEYNDFEAKYSCLYFPKFQEDLGFYIPMKSLDAAYLANKECKIVIGNDTVCLKDIENYQDLMNLNRAYYNMDKPMVLADMISFNPTNYDQNSVGPEYDSGWQQYNKRKVKLKARRVFKTIDFAPGVPNNTVKACQSLFHLEFCFRKKRWVGWINYSCKSEITYSNNILPGEYKGSKDGTSSHDWEFTYAIQITQDQQNWYYTFPAAECKAVVNYADLSNPLEFKWTMAGLQAVWSKSLISQRPEILPNY